MRTALQGVDGCEVLFNVDGAGVIVNTHSLTASACDLFSNLTSRCWVSPHPADPVDLWSEIAECTSESPKDDGVVVTSAAQSRGYTIPRAVKEVAQEALVVQDHRRYTAAGVNMARTLVAGGQVNLSDIAYISRYMARNDSTNPGWGLWGGDAGRRWVEGIARRVNLTAAIGDPGIQLAEFYTGDDDRGFYAQPNELPEQPGEVIGLYTITPEGTWQVWSNGNWHDAEDDDVPDQLVELDDDTAVYVGSSLFDAPDAPCSLRTFDPEEWDLHANAFNTIDWTLVDRAMAEGHEPTPVTAASPRDGTTRHDGNYTPQERSTNVQSQPRDKNGRFARVGDSGLMKNGLNAKIVTVNPVDASLIVRATDGNTYAVKSRDFEINGHRVPGGGGGGGAQQPPPPSTYNKVPQLNLNKILAQPRAVFTTPKAWLKHLLPPMNAAAMRRVTDGYEQFISDERQRYAGRFAGGTGFQESRVVTKPKLPGWAEDPKKLQRDLNTPFKLDPAFIYDPNRNKRVRRINDLVHRRNMQAAAIGEPGGTVTDAPLPPPSPDEGKLTPDTSDVPPMYLAIVDHDDPQAVMDLVAMIPATTTGTETTVFRRVAGKWIEDVKLLRSLRSATPPPVVSLDADTYKDVLTQVDAAGTQGIDDEKAIKESSPLAAAGGLDQNRGNAETLRRYWLYGKGAAKIRWNTGGDWTRCYRHLVKYLGPRAKGYCALRHHEATGMWPGDRRNVKHIGASGANFIRPYNQVLLASVETARADVARRRISGEANVIPAQAEDINGDRAGATFHIPLLIPEGVESGDGRTFNQGALTIRTLPLPLLWQQQTGEGHNGSVLVGRIDRIERIENGLGNAYGVFDTGPHGCEAQRLVGEGMLRFVSADLDQFEAQKTSADELAEDEPDDGKIKNDTMQISHARLMAATIVPKPAYQECTIELVPEEEIPAIPDGPYVGDPMNSDAEALVAAGMTALAIPVNPPRHWFNKPTLIRPTALQVTDDGQVYGHVASWDVCHIGLPGATRAPRSQSGYAYFHTGVVKTDEGAEVPVGQLTLAGGHADLTADAALAVKHYDDTGSAIADVHAGEDAYGIWVAGALRPGTTPEQIRTLRASAPSGDWRVINGRLEMVAVCQVNVPGFPITRAQVASGQMYALVAAGTAVLARQRSEPNLEFTSRLARLEEQENRRDQARVAAARSRVEPFIAEAATRAAAKVEEIEALAASARSRVYSILDIDGYLTEFKAFSDDKRQQLASEKKAMPDGSFPIENGADLRRAIKAHGRANEEDRPKVRRHIVRRARGLGKESMIPDSWSEASLTDLALNARDSRDVLVAAADRRNERELQVRVGAIRRRVQGS